MSKIYKKLLDIQSELHAPKNQFNNFGKYNYRSCEDIIEAVKPLLKKYKVIQLISDTMKEVGGRVYVQALVTLTCTEDSSMVSVTGYAREAENKKGMDDSQITGSTSSYARKYGLNGMYAIDDTKDADSTNTHGKEEKKQSDKKPTFSEKMQLAKKAVGEEFFNECLHGYSCETIADVKPEQQEEILGDLRKQASKTKEK